MRKIAETRVYDIVMRLPIVCLNFAFFWRECVSLRVFVVAHPFVGGDWGFLASLVARVGIILFLSLLVVFHASRWRPIRKFDRVKPKIDALMGTALIYLLLLCPRAEPDAGLDMAASILLIAGSYLCLLSVSSLGRSLSIMPEARKLVTDGLYAYVRHPLYLAELIANAGVFLHYRSFQAGLILFLVLVFLLRRMQWEESILSETFPAYDDYRLRSWRLIPGVY